MKPTIEQFKTRVENSEKYYQEGLRWYGEYNGKFYHKGIAITTECLGDAGGFLKEMENDYGFTLGKWDHQDNLGCDYIVSWSVDRFKKEDA